jgi:hypothetical protein
MKNKKIIWLIIIFNIILSSISIMIFAAEEPVVTSQEEQELSIEQKEVSDESDIIEEKIEDLEDKYVVSAIVEELQAIKLSLENFMKEDYSNQKDDISKDDAISAVDKEMKSVKILLIILIVLMILLIVITYILQHFFKQKKNNSSGKHSNNVPQKQNNELSDIEIINIFNNILSELKKSNELLTEIREIDFEQYELLLKKRRSNESQVIVDSTTNEIAPPKFDPTSALNKIINTNFPLPAEFNTVKLNNIAMLYPVQIDLTNGFSSFVGYKDNNTYYIYPNVTNPLQPNIAILSNIFEIINNSNSNNYTILKPCKFEFSNGGYLANEKGIIQIN